MKSPFSIGAQLGILILSVLTGLLLSSIITAIVLASLNIPTELINLGDPLVYLISGFFSQLLGFIGGFYLFLNLSKQSLKPLIKIEQINLKKVLIVIAILLISIPIIEILGYYNSFLKDFIPNNTFIIHEAKLKIYQSNILGEKGFGIMLSKFIIIALLPAIGEELVFRVVFLEKIKESSQNEHYAVVVSGLIFAAVHQQPSYLLPMVFLGIVLGYIYTRTKNIYYSMLFHFLFNSLTIISAYFGVGI
jgi:membrane protease YdiL (CAAX protease family)